MPSHDFETLREWAVNYNPPQEIIAMANMMQSPMYQRAMNLAAAEYFISRATEEMQIDKYNTIEKLKLLYVEIKNKIPEGKATWLSFRTEIDDREEHEKEIHFVEINIGDYLPNIIPLERFAGHQAVGNYQMLFNIHTISTIHHLRLMTKLFEQKLLMSKKDFNLIEYTKDSVMLSLYD